MAGKNDRPSGGVVIDGHAIEFPPHTLKVVSHDVGFFHEEES